MNSVISALVVDDESLARDLLRSLVEKESDFSVVAECSNGEAALAAIERHQPDVVFLDIEMPLLDGVGVAQRLRSLQQTPHIVFVTAFDRYAIAAFELNAVDYLVKPVSRQRCRESLSRIREAVHSKGLREMTDRLLEVVQGLKSRETADAPEQKLIVKKHDELVAVPLSDIVWAEAANQYVTIFTVNDSYIMSESLGRFAERLSDPRFVRIHRSALVNGHHVRSVKRNSNGTHSVRLINGQELPLARARASVLETLLNLSSAPSKPE